MVGGAWERAASYVNYANNSNLQTYGGTNAGDLYGANATEQSTSTKYKTVYEADGTSQADSYNNKAILMKGDAVYETSGTYSSSTGAWLGASSNFPDTGSPFFRRGAMTALAAQGDSISAIRMAVLTAAIRSAWLLLFSTLKVTLIFDYLFMCVSKLNVKIHIIIWFKMVIYRSIFPS